MPRDYMTRVFLLSLTLALVLGSALVAEAQAVCLKSHQAPGSRGLPVPLTPGIVALAADTPMIQVEKWSGGSQTRDPGFPFELLDGDSAFAALILVASRSPDRDLCGLALMRAAFIAYVKGDFARAEELFSNAAEKGAPDALLWQGLALFADGRFDDAAKTLRKALSSASDSVAAGAASVGLAACDLADGRAEEGAARCLEIVEGGGEGSAAASLLLQRCVLQLGDAAGRDAALERLAGLYPMAYEVAVIKGTKEPVASVPSQLNILEEDLTAEIEAPGTIGDEEPPESGIREVESEAGAPGEGTPESAPLEASAESVPLETSAEAEPEAESQRAPEAVPEVDTPRSGAPGTGTPEYLEREGYTVQVGAFEEIRNAEGLAMRLREKGYDRVRVESESRGGRTFHCVRIGGFANRTDAISLASVLNEKERLSTTIVKTIVPMPASQTQER